MGWVYFAHCRSLYSFDVPKLGVTKAKGNTLLSPLGHSFSVGFQLLYVKDAQLAFCQLFPTCQVRVVILSELFSSSFLLLLPPPSPPPRPPPLLPPLPSIPRPLLPCQLLAKLFANFGAQCALLDFNLGHSQLSAHRWTSTRDPPSSVRTAGPHPGTCRAQCAPLDLNLGPSELSAHRWTSKAR